MNLCPDFIDLTPILDELSGAKPLSPSSRGFHSILLVQLKPELRMKLTVTVWTK